MYCCVGLQVASTAGGARHLVAKGHLDRLLVSAGGGEGSDAEAPDPLLGASALRTLAKVLAEAEGVGLDVSGWLPCCRKFSRQLTVQSYHVAVRPETTHP